jgi:hypothetical protein
MSGSVQMKQEEALPGPAAASADAGTAHAPSKKRVSAKLQPPAHGLAVADDGRKQRKEGQLRQGQAAGASAREQRQQELSAGKARKRKGAPAAGTGGNEAGQQEQVERPSKKKRSPALPPQQQQQQQQARSPTPAAAAAAQALEMSAPPSTGTLAAARQHGKRHGGSRAAKGTTVQAGQAGDLGPGTLQVGGQGHRGDAAAGTRAALDLADTAAGYLLTRLTVPRSREAATMQLRPRLQVGMPRPEVGWCRPLPLPWLPYDQERFLAPHSGIASLS